MRYLRYWGTTIAILAIGGCAAGQGNGEAPAPAPDAREAPAEGSEGGDEAQAAAESGSPEQPDAEPRYPPAVERGGRVAEIRVEPSPIELEEGDTLRLSELEVTPVDGEGRRVEGIRLISFLQSRTARVDAGRLLALEPGRTEMIVAVLAPPEDGEGSPQPRMFRTPVIVRPAPVAEVEVLPPEHAVYTGTSAGLRVRALTASGAARDDAELAWRSRNPEVASVTPAGWVRGLSPGNATIVATAEGVEGTLEIRVRENPVRSVELTPSTPTVSTGDVVRFEAVARDAGGRPVEDVALTYSVSGGASRAARGASVYEDGSFVAARPGDYRVVASAGAVSAE
ncbi:MAG TPA: Ig-like domain-containing protein, partial [Longimicrobiales bacterium]|nr:Ig-like domain-containing protein [Longimicrobiales bacterium]